MESQGWWVPSAKFLYVVKLTSGRTIDSLNLGYLTGSVVSSKKTPLYCAGECCCLVSFLKRVARNQDVMTYVTCVDVSLGGRTSGYAMGDRVGRRVGRGVFLDILQKMEDNHRFLNGGADADDCSSCCPRFMDGSSVDFGHHLCDIPSDGISERAYVCVLDRQCPSGTPPASSVDSVGGLLELDRKSIAIMCGDVALGGDYVCDDSMGRYSWYSRLHPWNPFSSNHV